jgi:prepilin-type N-terminal cleavage/methylation domain-containing protein
MDYRQSQNGFTLIETLVAVAIVTLAIGGLIAAMGVFARFSTHQVGPVHSAATLQAEQLLRVVQDAWKYGSPGAAPVGAWQATLPLNLPSGGATSAPASVSTSISIVNAQSAQVTINVRYTPDPEHSADPGLASTTGQTQVKSPMPGATVLDPSLIPAPAGAP